jgi:diguanylate cyclase (GGDEF)-like protein
LPISAILLCDIDFFKRYNDRYGHAFKWRRPQVWQKRLNLVPRRPADLAARYGGEEFFAVILPNTLREWAQLYS